jgi:hypothetical protein
MIFLSHNSKDKDIVEPIALKLRDEFGQDNVFYDSWSIQPGDGIIEKMNEGIEKCEVCFYFVSSNSLNSFMVNLEWQNVLMKMSKGKARLIPVRIDACEMPAILTQNLYIDLYTIGVKQATIQIIDSVKGNNTFRPKYETTKNLVVHLTPSYGTHIDIKLEAKHFPIQNTKFVFLSQASQGDISYDSKHLLYREFGYKENFMEMTSPNIKLNAFMLDFKKPLAPGFPLYAEFNSNNESLFSIMFVYHERKEGEWEVVEMQVNNQVLSI